MRDANLNELIVLYLSPNLASRAQLAIVLSIRRRFVRPTDKQETGKSNLFLFQFQFASLNESNISPELVNLCARYENR